MISKETRISESDLKGSVTEAIKYILSGPEYAFNAYILMKNTHEIKNFMMYEGSPQKQDSSKNLKRKMQLLFAHIIETNYLDSSAEYDSVSNIADNQRKFYVIPQTDEYRQFPVSDYLPEVKTAFCSSDFKDAEGLLLSFSRADKYLWAFQYFWQNTVVNRHGRFNVFPDEQSAVFYELSYPVLSIGQKIDLLVIDDCIITDDITLLQSHYHFQEFIRSTAEHIISEISSLNLVTNTDKLFWYISRPKLTYAKKMLRIRESKVLKQPRDILFKRITTLPRWKGKFEIDTKNNTIFLKNEKHIENLIDLLDERYTRSDVTSEEYDTSAKKWIPQVVL